MKNRLTLAFLGRSGSGKGTQAGFLVKKLERGRVSHLETGRFLRALVAKYDNATFRMVRKDMLAGRIAPSWLASYAWLKEIVEKGVATKHWVFDGAPRTVWEAALIDWVASWHGRKLPLGVFINLSEEEATRRLVARGRHDDTRSSIKNRMKFFERDVSPVVKFYRRKGRLIEVDGDQSIEEVRMAIGRALKKKLKSAR